MHACGISKRCCPFCWELDALINPIYPPNPNSNTAVFTTRTRILLPQPFAAHYKFHDDTFTFRPWIPPLGPSSRPLALLETLERTMLKRLHRQLEEERWEREEGSARRAGAGGPGVLVEEC